MCVDSTCRAAVALGYRVTLVSDGHTTFDSPVLPAEKIIAHRNRTLGDGFVDLRSASDVDFGDEPG
jgi:nicotinamidase-related amidase